MAASCTLRRAPCRRRGPSSTGSALPPGRAADRKSHFIRRRNAMVTKALYVRLEAKPGKEAEVEAFLRGGLAIVQQEPATTAWFALRMGPSTFGIFDAFPDDAGRQAQ